MHALPKLAYAYDALEPYIDEATMRLHHGKHHQAYVDKLNAALERYPDEQKKSLEDLLLNLDSLPAEIRATVRNHGGGHYNHSLFWAWLTPAGRGPSERLELLLTEHFGGVQTFKDRFREVALSQFGSGWAWLIKKSSKQLEIISTPNQDTSLARGSPVFGIDVWEHAYYLRYQNRRADYLEAVWSVVNWPEVEKRLFS